MIIEGHEGSDKNVNKLIKKYKISEADSKMAKDLLFIIKDADALDRCRLTVNTPIGTLTNLEPRYLRTNTSKRLMDVSYGIENLTHNVKEFNDILSYKTKRKEEKNKAHNKWAKEYEFEVKGIDQNTLLKNRENIKDRNEKEGGKEI